MERLHRVLGGRFGQLVGLMLFLSCVMGAASSLLSLSELVVHFAGGQWVAAAPLPWNKLGSWPVVLLASTLLAALTVATAVAPKLSSRVLRWVFAASIIAVVSVVVFLSIPKAVREDAPTPSAALTSGLSMTHFKENLLPHRSQQFRRMISTLVAMLISLIGTSFVAYDSVTRTRRVPGHTTNQSYHTAQLLAIKGILKALATCGVVWLFLVLVVAASIPSPALLSNPYVVLDSVDHALGVVVVVLGVTASSVLSAFANTMTATSIFTTFFTSQVRWAATLPNSVSKQTNTSRQASQAHSTREGAPLEGNNGLSHSWMGSWVPAVSRLAVMWLICQVVIFWCGALDPVVPLATPIMLIAFATLNFACFFKEITSPVFHDAFRMVRSRYFIAP